MKFITYTFLVMLVVISTQANARNQYREFSVKDAMTSETFTNRLGSEVRFYFGSKPSNIKRTYGEWPTLKKTNAFNKSDEKACRWALLSALLTLKKRALAEGGNAVIVKTNNDHRPKSSSKTFECEVGNVVASVALLGTVVKAQ